MQTISEAMSFGKMLANSAFVPKDFRGKPEDCVLAVQFGAELGLGPLQSTQSIAVVNGRPSIYGDAAIALAKASAVCEYITEKIDGEGEQMVATCTAKRRGDPTPTVATFAVADAKKAGLWAKSGPWSQYPRRMLQMRARGFCLRDAFPDVLRGLVTVEEAADYTHVDPEPIQATATQVEQPKPPTADDAAVAKAIAAIDVAETPEQVRKYALAVQQKANDGFYTPEQAADLLDRLDERAAMMEEGVPA